MCLLQQLNSTTSSINRFEVSLDVVHIVKQSWLHVILRESMIKSEYRTCIKKKKKIHNPCLFYQSIQGDSHHDSRVYHHGPFKMHYNRAETKFDRMQASTTVLRAIV